MEEMRSKRGNVCLTNEHRTSQTCLYCFEQLEHPFRVERKGERLLKLYTKGSFMCVNPKCVSFKHGRALKSRDALSSLAIGFSGLSSVLLGMPIPHFSPYKISQFNTEQFKTAASPFCKEEENSQLRSN